MSLVAGLAVGGLGALLLADQTGGLELTFGVAGPASLAVVGAVLFAGGLDRRAFMRHVPRAWQAAAGLGLLVLGALLAMREVGVWIGDVLVWPAVLLVVGAAVLWRQAAETPRAEVPEEPEPERLSADARTRVLVGAALIVGGALVFLWLADALRPARDVILAVVVVLLAAALILAPWWLRLVRRLQTERAQRIRSQERAEVAAHLHDSVLQTLALMQKRSDDPRAVATLARRQERELRAWLNGGRPPGAATDSFAASLEQVAAEVEAAHGAVVDVVTVGDAPLDERAHAVLAAAREAMTNAAKFAPGAPVSVYAEAGDGALQVFVRDRGPGFDPAAVPGDRRGIRESITGRMERHGGRAQITSSPEGTEVEIQV